MHLQETMKDAAVILFSFNAYTWLCIVGVLIYINWRRTPHPKFPPGPKGVPMLGVIPFLSKQPGKDFKRWSAKYGPIMSVRMGTESTVVLNTFDSIYQVFVQQGQACADRPFIKIFCNITKHNGFIFKKYGDDFKTQKHFALKYLREQGLGKMKMQSIVNDEGDRFLEYLGQLQQTEQQVDFQHTLCQATSNVIWKMLRGSRFEYDDPKFKELLYTLNMMFTDPEHATRQGLIYVWNFLAKLPYFSTTMQDLDEKMRFVLSKCKEDINEHKKRFDPGNIKDFIDEFLLKQQNGVEGFTDVQLTTLCRDFFVAGSETSSTTLSWLFVIYMNFPEHRKIIDEEIRTVLGPAGTPTMAKRSEMPFTCAFIQEGMRYRTTVPLGALHLTMSDMKIEDLVIPKSTKVIANLQGLHMDPTTWPDPERFDPYRHLDENGRFVQSSKIIPFAIGSRVCIGESLARVEIFVFFVKILQRFRVESASGQLPPLDKEVVSTVLAPRECLVKLTPRT